MIRRILYWTAVLLVSLVGVAALVLYLESLDNSSVGGSAPSAFIPAASPAL